MADLGDRSSSSHAEDGWPGATRRRPAAEEGWPGASGRPAASTTAPATPSAREFVSDVPDRPVDDRPTPPESWPGAGGKRSVAPPPRTAEARASAAAGELMRSPAHRVDRRAVSMWTVTGLLTGLGPLAAAIALQVFGPDDWGWRTPLLIAVIVLVIAYVAIMPTWRYRVHRWEVGDDVVYTQSGWWKQDRRIAPISRVQTVDSEFGPIARLFGLGSVTVTTASAAGPLKIDGLPRETVEKIVADLTTETIRVPGDAT